MRSRGRRRKLLEQFGLPEGLWGDLTCHVLTNRLIPVPNTMVTEEVGNWPALGEYLGEDDWYINCAYSAGLPETVPGELVVIRMVVNEYTTKKELISQWEHIERARERYCQGGPVRVTNRRRAGPGVDQQIEKWLKWYLARKVEGKSLLKVADQFGEPEETVRNGIDQMDQLMQPLPGPQTPKK